MLLIVWVVLATPIMVCFAPPETDPGLTAVEWIDLIVDLMFTADIWFNFRTAYISSEGRLVSMLAATAAEAPPAPVAQAAPPAAATAGETSATAACPCVQDACQCVAHIKLVSASHIAHTHGMALPGSSSATESSSQQPAGWPHSFLTSFLTKLL
jgi:hypothetical protein